MALKRDKYDAIFSDLIRERADYTCERCGSQEPGRKSRAIHCAHIHGRRGRSTRWDIDNAVCLCAKCHFWFTDHPTEFTLWLEEYLGHAYLDILREKALNLKKWSKSDLEEMYEHYKKELRRIECLRNDGVCGYITVDGW